VNAEEAVDWYELEAKSSAKELWAVVKWEGQGDVGPWLLPDGREILDLIATGDVDELGFPIWFEPYQSYRNAGDLIWTTAWMKLASQRFVDVLTSIKATGFQTYDANLRSKKGEPIPGFVGLGVNSSSEDTDLSNQYPAPTFSFRARPRVVQALRTAGVTDLKIKPWRPED
jgi:hypothetical protein